MTAQCVLGEQRVYNTEDFLCDDSPHFFVVVRAERRPVLEQVLLRQLQQRPHQRGLRLGEQHLVFAQHVGRRRAGRRVGRRREDVLVAWAYQW